MENQMPELGASKAPVEKKIETKGPIKVVALRAGFFGQRRIVEGMRFEVPSEKHLGEWMKCEDSNIEKKRVEFFKKKKEAQKQKLKTMDK